MCCRTQQKCHCIPVNACGKKYLAKSAQTTWNESTPVYENLFVNIRPTNYVVSSAFNSQPQTIRTILSHAETKRFGIDDVVFQDILQKKQDAVLLTLPDKSSSALMRVNIFAQNFQWISSSKGRIELKEESLHYQGSLLDESRDSLVALSLFPGSKEIAGIISSDKVGNYSLGPVSPLGSHVFFAENNHKLTELDRDGPSKWMCSMPEPKAIKIAKEDFDGPTTHSLVEAQENKVVRLYVETDYDVFTQLGSFEIVAQYVANVMNSVIKIFSNEGIPVVLSQVFIWDEPSPYSDKTEGEDILKQFVSHRKQFEGDFGILIAFRGNTGIANSLDGWGTASASDRSASLSFAGVKRGYAEYPAYSWTVDCITHEIAHTMQMYHTHTCAFNGNQTAIDGCAGYVEGSQDCELPPIPDSKSTYIMSYCHLKPVGKNLINGFGQQHGNLLRSLFTKNAHLLQSQGSMKKSSDILSFNSRIFAFFSCIIRRKK